jgi:hypothetical protein
VNPGDPIEPEGVFDGLSGAAITLGVFVDIGSTLLLSTLLLAWLAPGAFTSDEAAAVEAVDALYATTPFAVLLVGVGTLGTTLGAFVGARRAGTLHVRHGGWIAVASAATSAAGLLLLPPDPVTTPPFWIEMLGWILVLPAGVLGGALARALRRSGP